MVALWVLAYLISLEMVGSISAVTFTKEHQWHMKRPVLPDRPFISVWNIETGPCKTQYGVDIDLSDFDIVYNKNQRRDGNKMMIFYSSLLGNYPRFLDDDGKKAVNGGLPQLGNLTAHLNKCVNDIKFYIPNSSYSGLAVIDWEAWTPLWSNMGWGSRKIYQQKSVEKVHLEHPEWNKDQLIEQATIEYEAAAKKFILNTLTLCKKMRPNAYWGFYLYPDCYNYAKTGTDLSCPSRQIVRDDKIQWMFNASSALYPSTYLGIWFKDADRARSYVANRIGEAQRVDYNRHDMASIPVYVYNNLVYRKTRIFLTRKDVIDSSGLALVMGASGVILWGDHMHENKSWCLELSRYVNTTLGPFLKFASDAAAHCSLAVCSGNGRCILASNDQKNAFSKNTSLLMDKLLKMVFRKQQFNSISLTCQCYEGWSGKTCNKHSQLHK